MEQVSSLAQLTTDADTPIKYSDVLKDWNIIHAVNYRHIFDVARQLVDAIATDDELGRQNTICSLPRGRTNSSAGALPKSMN